MGAKKTAHRGGLVRVLIVDDSAFSRRTLRNLLLSCREIEVVGTAVDGNEGLKLVEQHQPDVICTDLEMPRLDGFAFLRILMRSRPTPVIVVSSHSDKQTVLKALEAGALDFVAKPERQASPNLKQIRGELVDKVLAGATSAVEQLRRRAESMAERPTHPAPSATGPRRKARPARQVVVIGASTGGPSSLRRILSQLPGDLPWATVIAQHMPPKFTKAFAERLDREFPQFISEATDGHLLGAGEVLVGPGGRHTEVVQGQRGYELRVHDAESGDRYAPSVDRLFLSAADVVGSRLTAVILTGMGSDGAMGVQYVQFHKGHVVAEDRSTAVVFGMPQVAIETGVVHDILPLERIAPRLLELGRRFIKTDD